MGLYDAVLARDGSDCALERLNDDCLLQIFAQLALRDQFALLQLSARFGGVVLCLWRRKYSRCVDLRALRHHLKALTDDDDQEQLFALLAPLTAELAHLDGDMWARVEPLLRHSVCGNVARLSLDASDGRSSSSSRLPRAFPALRSLRLRHNSLSIVPHLDALSDLDELHLLDCVPHEAATDFTVLFRRLRLTTFAYTPAQTSSPRRERRESPLHAIERCRTLRSLTLGAVDAAAAIDGILRLPLLQRLTVVCTGQDSDEATAIGQRRLMVRVARLRGAHVEALRLHCPLERPFAKHLMALPAVEVCVWRSFLHVDYAADGSGAKWRAHDPRVTCDLLQTITTTWRHLRHLDLRRNCHVTPAIAARVRRRLQQRHVLLQHDDHDHSTSAGERPDVSPGPWAFDEGVGYFQLDFATQTP